MAFPTTNLNSGAAALHLLAAEPDTSKHRWIVQVHGVAPLLFKEGSDQLLPDLQAYAKDQYFKNQQRIQRLQTELNRLLLAFSQAQIQAIPLKGAQLIQRHYADPALRPMADLDLLVRPKDEAKAMECLATLGYFERGHTPRHREFGLQSWPRQIVDTEGEHPQNPMSLDLHTAVQEELWGLSYPLTERLWQAWNGKSLEDWALLEHLLIHASFDMRVGKLRWMQLYDIALVAPNLTPHQWSLLSEHARQLGMERFLWASLSLASRTFSGIAPAGFLENLAKNTPKRLIEWVTQSSVSFYSYCNPSALPFTAKLAWYQPGLEWAAALRCMALPSPRELRQWFPKRTHWAEIPGAYLRYARHALGWWFNRARGGKRRAWPYKKPE